MVSVRFRYADDTKCVMCKQILLDPTPLTGEPARLRAEQWLEHADTCHHWLKRRRNRMGPIPRGGPGSEHRGVSGA